MEPVSAEGAFAVFRENLDRLRRCCSTVPCRGSAPNPGRLCDGAEERDRVMMSAGRSFPAVSEGCPDSAFSALALDRSLTELDGGHTPWNS